MSALPLSATSPADPTAATRALLAHAQEEWVRQRDEADAARRRAVTAALDAGMTLNEVADAMGVSRNRVFQIKHDTR